MRYILSLLLIIACYGSIIWDISVETTLGNRYSKIDYLGRNKAVSSAFRKFWNRNNSLNKGQEKVFPKVKLQVFQNNDESYTWDTDVRYTIDVSDLEDGDSKYGEINGNEVLLEIEFLPTTDDVEIKKIVNKSVKELENKGLSLLKKSTCFGCHADKTVLAGPSFSQMAERYEKNTLTINSLARHIKEGSTGEWGSIEMPSHPDFTVEETEQIAEYVLIQGGKKNNWILPGLEGTFRIIKKPDNLSKGIYKLTASYTSTSSMKGQHSMVLKIK